MVEKLGGGQIFLIPQTQLYWGQITWITQEIGLQSGRRTSTAGERQLGRIEGYFNKQTKAHLVKVRPLHQDKQGGALQRTDQWERADNTQQQSAGNIHQKHFLVGQALDSGWPLFTTEVLLDAESITSFQNMQKTGAPGWLSRLSVQLRLRSWSCGSQVWAPRGALCWQLRAWSLLLILCLPLSLTLPSFMLCLSLSQK